MLEEKLKINFKNDNSTVLKSIVKIYGIGAQLSKQICRLSGICMNQKAKELEYDQIESISKLLSANNLKLEQELRKKLLGDVEKLIEIKSYRGLRRVKGYPVRGQRTHSNAKTSRKNKRSK